MTHPVDEPARAPERSGPGGLVRLRLDIAYDGARFCGWARQPGLRSVQGELESALREVLRVPGDVPVRAAVAGRTDAGVHAVGQVCHADVPPALLPAAPGVPDGATAHPADSGSATDLPILLRRLAGRLPADLRVRRVGRAPEGFDARWSARWRQYRYLVADCPAAMDPRTRGHVLWGSRSLDVAAMDRAAAGIVGEHDFAAFCRAREGASSVRTVLAAGWRRGGVDEPVAFDIRADAFCHSMVRALVGALLAVGEGRWPVDRPGALLTAGVRVPSARTAPAHALTLMAVGYPPADELAAQAARSRRWRGPAQG